MNYLNKTLFAAVLLSLAAPAAAQDDTDFDRARGEVSVGASAPSVEGMIQAIDTASPESLATILEYGERVECHACVPLLERALVESDDAQVREMAAWWLRRRPFGIAPVFREVRGVLANDASPVRRARAAEALGTFMFREGIPYLMNAAADPDPRVRAAVVRSLGLINSPASHAGIAQAFEDSDRDVRETAVAQVLYVNGFRDYEPLMGLLADEDMQVRRRAALALGTFEVAEAVPALVAMLSDENLRVRQAAAWSLGRIGTSEARAALVEGRAAESDRLVLDAYDVALAMR
jgi:HEAT repeat protein